MLRLLVLAFAFLAAPLAAQTTPFEARELAPGIHLLATPPDFLGPAIGNVTIAEQADGLVLIDTGATIGHGRAVASYIRSVTDKPVKAVVFTYWHNDHPLGIAAIRGAWCLLSVYPSDQRPGRRPAQAQPRDPIYLRARLSLGAASAGNARSL